MPAPGAHCVEDQPPQHGYRTRPLRRGAVAQLAVRVEPPAIRGSRDDWVAKLRGADIVSAPINTLLEASNDPDVLANGYVAEVDYPKYGKRLKVHGSPWHFSETPACFGIAPELGADNDTVPSELGYTPVQIENFRERKII